MSEPKILCRVLDAVTIAQASAIRDLLRIVARDKA